MKIPQMMTSTIQATFLLCWSFFSADDQILRQHLAQPRLRNATYLSPHIQNQIISIIGYDFIRASVVDEVKKSKYYAILAEEILAIIQNTE